MITKKHNESNPHQTLKSLPPLATQQELVFPDKITTSDNVTMSSLGSNTSNGLIQVGSGKYIPSSFQASHQSAYCQVTNEYCDAGSSSFSDRRRKRGRCQVCQKKTTTKCSICQQWICNQSSATVRTCFFEHQQTNIKHEQESHWRSMQKT